MDSHEIGIPINCNHSTTFRGTSIDSPEDTSIAGDSACIPWRSPIDIATSMVQCLRSPISSRKRHRDDVVGNEMVLQQNYYLDDTSSTCDADAASKVMATTRSFQPLKFVTQCLVCNKHRYFHILFTDTSTTSNNIR